VTVLTFPTSQQWGGLPKGVAQRVRAWLLAPPFGSVLRRLLCNRRKTGFGDCNTPNPKAKELR